MAISRAKSKPNGLRQFILAENIFKRWAFSLSKTLENEIKITTATFSLPISWADKILIEKVHLLHDDGDGCYASNEYLAEFMGVKTAYMANQISKLVELDFLDRKLEHGKMRRLFSKVHSPSQKNDPPPQKNDSPSQICDEVPVDLHKNVNNLKKNVIEPSQKCDPPPSQKYEQSIRDKDDIKRIGINTQNARARGFTAYVDHLALSAFGQHKKLSTVFLPIESQEFIAAHVDESKPAHLAAWANTLMTYEGNYDKAQNKYNPQNVGTMVSVFRDELKKLERENGTNKQHNESTSERRDRQARERNEFRKAAKALLGGSVSSTSAGDSDGSARLLVSGED